MGHKYGMINRRKVFDCIESHSEGIRSSQIAEELGLSVNEVRSHIMRLCMDGEVQHIARVEPTCTKIWGVRR